MEYEFHHFIAGDDFINLIDFEGFKIGVLICFDIEYPEPARVLALNGANFIICPAATKSHFTYKITVPARAAENHCFIAYMNRVGKEGECIFSGGSCLIGVDGLDITGAGESTDLLITGVLDKNKPEYVKYCDENPFFRDRRPQLYSKITAVAK